MQLSKETRSPRGDPRPAGLTLTSAARTRPAAPCCSPASPASPASPTTPSVPDRAPAGYRDAPGPSRPDSRLHPPRCHWRAQTVPGAHWPRHLPVSRQRPALAPAHSFEATWPPAPPPAAQRPARAAHAWEGARGRGSSPGIIACPAEPGPRALGEGALGRPSALPARSIWTLPAEPAPGSDLHPLGRGRQADPNPLPEHRPSLRTLTG